MQGTDYLPGLRRRYQRGRVVAAEVNPEVAWTPEVACVLIASESLDTEQHIRNLSGLDRKRWGLPVEHHTGRWWFCPSRDFIAIILHRERETCRQRCTHGRFMCPEMQ